MAVRLKKRADGESLPFLGIYGFATVVVLERMFVFPQLTMQVAAREKIPRVVWVQRDYAVEIALGFSWLTQLQPC